MEIYLIIAIGFFGLLIAFGLAVANFSGERLYSIYNEYGGLSNRRGMTGLDFALAINHEKFNSRLKVIMVKGVLSDYYNTGAKTIAVSEINSSSDSIAAIAVVAHELGHALQDATASKRFKRFLTLNRVGKTIGFLMLPSMVVGIVLMLLGGVFTFYGIVASAIALTLFLLALVIKFYTIKMEKEASLIGLKLLDNVLTSEEKKHAKRLLNAAKLTYWGDFFRVLLSWTFLTRKTKFF